jgi:hypothetical protein
MYTGHPIQKGFISLNAKQVGAAAEIQKITFTLSNLPAE